MLKSHYDPKPLVIAERFHFHKREQGSIAEYEAGLRKLCKFGQYLDDALRDRFVCGLRHEGTQKRLLAERELTFTKARDIALGVEAAEKNLKEVRNVATPKCIQKISYYFSEL